MAKKRKTRRNVCVTKGSARKYKKCLIAKMRGTKIVSMKSARRSFRAAVKRCRPLLGIVPRKKSKKKRRRSKIPWL